jgi:hypothetical protein
VADERCLALFTSIGSDMPVVSSLLERSRQDSTLSGRSVTAIFWTPIVGALVCALARLDKDVYRFLLTDDGPVEWAQFACYCVACIAAFGIAVQRGRAGHRWQATLFSVLGTGLLFVSGEEIAWGQRVFNLETPERFEEINKQNEITLHNVGDALVWMNAAMMVAAAVALAAPFLNRWLRLERIFADADRLFVPPVYLAPAFLVVFGYRMIRLTLVRDPGFTVTKYGEWAEFCLAFASAIFLWTNFRHRPDRSPVEETLAGPPTT